MIEAQMASLNELAGTIVSNAGVREAYIALLGRLRLNATNNCRSILVTSTQPNEGKTTVSLCLAITASLAGQAVLLIDGDLRRRGLAAAAGIMEGIGLTEILESEAGAIETVHPLTVFDATRPAGPISIMAAGRRSPAILPALDWVTARARLHGIMEGFALVIIDSPPVLAANDALLLGGIVDGILLVIDAEGADREQVQRAKMQLELINTPVLGAVLNRFDPKVHGQSTQPHQGYYLDSQR
jgi:capsular exopolysaccharide synthesis family protein